MTREERGWFWPPMSRKAHFFVDGRSLCRKWGFPGPLTPDNGRSGPDDCAGCRRALDRERAR